MSSSAAAAGTGDPATLHEKEKMQSHGQQGGVPEQQQQQQQQQQQRHGQQHGGQQGGLQGHGQQPAHHARHQTQQHGGQVGQHAGGRTAHAYACKQPGLTVEPMTIEFPPLGSHEIGIRVTHTGIGALDLHLMKGEWNEKVCKFPLVPGHEIVGVVEEIGSDVIALQPGDRVGVGYMGQCCLHCDFCAAGHEQFCPRGKAVGAMGNCGGLTDYIQVHQSMVFGIPANLDSARTAPLLMAGTTVYHALVEAVEPHMTVVVYGVGGVGHLAIKFARAMGLKVIAVDVNESKRSAALKLGAHAFHTVDEVIAKTTQASTVTTTASASQQHCHNCADLVLICSEHGDFNQLIPLLRHNGRMSFLCSSQRKVEIPIFPDLVMKNVKITGVLLGSRIMTRRMLKFAAHNDIGADVEIVPCKSVEDVNKAIKHVEDDSLFFRMVLSCEK